VTVSDFPSIDSAEALFRGIVASGKDWSATELAERIPHLSLE